MKLICDMLLLTAAFKFNLRRYSLAYDNVHASQLPEKWDLNILYIVSSAIGLTALASSLVLLSYALSSTDPNGQWAAMGLPQLTYGRGSHPFTLALNLSNSRAHS